jgi:hypothetical protein
MTPTTQRVPWEGTMPVGEIFLYGVWAAIALAAIVSSALMFRAH